jgi:hypothetical protein
MTTQQPSYSGEIDLTIGAMDGEEVLLFGRIGGLAVDRQNRLYVADEQLNDIRVFSEHGRFLFRFGRSGRGPGDLDRPCCMAFDRAGRLWVLSLGLRARRYDVFAVRDKSADFVRRINLPASPTMYRPAWADDGRIFVPAAISSAQKSQHMLLVLDSVGAELSRVLVPMLWPMEHQFPVVIPSRSGQHTILLRQPFAPRERIAFGPDGRFAYVLTSRFFVRCFSSSGQQVGTVSRDLRAPSVEAAERDSVREELERARAQVIRSGGRFPSIPIPETKPVIRDVWYDSDGRLWIQLTPRFRDTVARAYVYSSTGSEFLFFATWPIDVVLSSRAAITGLTALGTRTLDSGVEQLVRLRFR